MNYGDFRIDLHEGPIFVLEPEKCPRNGRFIDISITPSSTVIEPKAPPQASKDIPEDVAQRFSDRFKSKREKEEEKKAERDE